MKEYIPPQYSRTLNYFTTHLAHIPNSITSCSNRQLSRLGGDNIATVDHETKKYGTQNNCCLQRIIRWLRSHTFTVYIISVQPLYLQSKNMQDRMHTNTYLFCGSSYDSRFRGNAAYLFVNWWNTAYFGIAQVGQNGIQGDRAFNSPVYHINSGWPGNITLSHQSPTMRLYSQISGFRRNKYHFPWNRPQVKLPKTSLTTILVIIMSWLRQVTITISGSFDPDIDSVWSSTK